ncbi:uncharacterized protein [Nicotiana tomentosiformis]|uniref:uncharacterized protein isoform X3 n=1 Tax=Nicotiana tomentosiformis TaxID=4098 RepID=UPI00388C9710
MKKSVPLHQICKGKSIVEPSNNNNNNYTEQMDVDHISNGEEATQKFTLFNQLSNGEEAKKKSVPPYQICKGKNIMEPSNNNTQMDADQASSDFWVLLTAELGENKFMSTLIW